MADTDTQISHSLSIVVPLYNEAENVEPLLARLQETLQAYPHRWELILVDDGSSDETSARVNSLRPDYGEHVHLIQLRRNYGQTAAMQAGIDAARGSVIVTMDGDLQNDPADIPRLVQRLLEEDLDLVAGWRKHRQDNVALRLIPSWTANRLIGKVTGIRLHDYGCSLKAFRSEVIKGVRLYGEMHRFIPAWLATQTSPAHIAEEVVAHHPRLRGDSKYGLSRTFRVLLDVLVVFFFTRYPARPGHFFGAIGLVCGAVGGGMLGYLLLLKLLGESIGTRPLLLVGIMLVMVAVQIFTTAVLSEMLSRTYYESNNTKSYRIRRSSVNRPDQSAGWFPANTVEQKLAQTTN
jgi:glycosyltransferase involved in cell wall biosynthesis